MQLSTVKSNELAAEFWQENVLADAVIVWGEISADFWRENALSDAVNAYKEEDCLSAIQRLQSAKA